MSSKARFFIQAYNFKFDFGRIYKKSFTDCDPTVSGSDCYLANFVFWQRQFENILAVITFLAWISLFKFFSDFQSMAVFTKTLSRCST